MLLFHVVHANRELSYSFSSSTTSSPVSNCSSLLSQTVVSSESQLLMKSYASYTKKHNQSSSVSSIRNIFKTQFTILTVLLLVTNIFSLAIFSLLYTHKCHISSPLLPPSTITKGKNER